MDELFVYVKFSISEEGYPDFKDALFIPYDDYLELSQDDIDDMKDERHDAWKLVIDGVPE